MNNPILCVKDLEKTFQVRTGMFGKQGIIHAVNHVSLELARGETLGLVGESGCGKSSLGRTILKVYEPDSGTILFDGNDITTLSREQMRPYRKRMQMIFQDPYASLNPRFTIGEMIAEPMKIYNIGSADERAERVKALLKTVGLRPDHSTRYPHEFSGGQRQRIGIARALSLDPDFMVCDEPISALDVSIQAQIVNLLEEIQAKRNISYLFIAHDITMVQHISHRIGVMYMGSLVEVGNADEICNDPLHPYTKALISAVPRPDPRKERERTVLKLPGEPPSPLNLPAGCPFSLRCRYASKQCREEMPQLRQVSGRTVACHRVS